MRRFGNQLITADDVAGRDTGQIDCGSQSNLRTAYRFTMNFQLAYANDFASPRQLDVIANGDRTAPECSGNDAAASRNCKNSIDWHPKLTRGRAVRSPRMFSQQ